MALGKISTPILSTQQDIADEVRSIITRINSVVDAVNTLSNTPIEFSVIKDLPTTLEGYGIVDAAKKIHKHVVADITDFPAIPVGGGVGVTSLPWKNITSKPTTVDGFGITDASKVGHTHSFASLTGKPTTLGGYGITDGGAPANYDTLYYRKTDVDNRLAQKVDAMDGLFDGLYAQRQTLDKNYIIPATDIAVMYGPLDIHSTLDVQGTLLVL